MKELRGCNWIFEREILIDNPGLIFSELQLNLFTKKENWLISHIVLTIYIEIYLFFNKILCFLKIGKSSNIILNISPSPFGILGLFF